jgi:hypothetical protein
MEQVYLNLTIPTKFQDIKKCSQLLMLDILVFSIETIKLNIHLEQRLQFFTNEQQTMP